MSSQCSLVLWKKRHSISWHSIESDSSPWWWALPFLYVTSSEVLKVVLSRLVILPRRIIPQFQSPEQMNQISHVEIHSAKCVRVEHQVTSTYPLTLRSSSISHPLVSRKEKPSAFHKTGSDWTHHKHFHTLISYSESFNQSNSRKVLRNPLDVNSASVLKTIRYL